MVINTEELVSKINEELFRRAGKGVVWHHDEASGYRWLVKRAGSLRWVTGPIIRKLGRDVFREIKAQGIQKIDDVLDLCDDLLSRQVSEYRVIAFQWSFRLKRYFEPRHFNIFERWAKSYLTGWGSCDDFCTHSMGYFVYRYPQVSPKVKRWVSHPKPPVRRAAAVAFIYSLRRGQALEHIFEVADALLTDTDIYVLKGYGWMLKEATKYYQDAVFEYVQKHKAIMPRVSLRYAIEKMPQDMKDKAMARD
ncbi:MAG: DNA alkylation repair protein [Promethearchaeota archaeon]